MPDHWLQLLIPGYLSGVDTTINKTAVIMLIFCLMSLAWLRSILQLPDSLLRQHL